MSRPPKQFLDDLYKIGAVNVTKVAKRPKIDKNLYEVEIVVVTKGTEFPVCWSGLSAIS